jgi:hypothetical protein
MSYEQNFKSHFNNVGIGLRYDFSFSQVGLSAWRSNYTTTLVQSARGSFIYEGKPGRVNVNNRTSVGTAGILVLPFLDLNSNGRRDAGEPKVEGLRVAVNGGRVIQNKRDTTVSILDLEPYSSCFIDMARNSFESGAWQVKKQTVSVVVDPNSVKLVEVPIVVMGEVAGMVYLKEKNKEQAGLGRITVCFYREDSSLVAHVLTEADGFFSFIGLVPGNYTARIDAAQLRKLGMTALPAAIPFHIADSREGDVVDGLEFLLQR